MNGIYDPKRFDPPSSIGSLISRVRIALHSALDQQLAPFDLTTPQYVVLVLLANGLVYKSADICKVLCHDPGAMTRLIDRLETKGLIRRVRNVSDRRAFDLELTDTGHALYPEIVEVAVEVLNRFLVGFTKPEVRQMEGYLKKMLQNAGETVPTALDQP